MEDSIIIIALNLSNNIIHHQLFYYNMKVSTTVIASDLTNVANLHQLFYYNMQVATI